MSIFASIERVSLDIPARKGKVDGEVRTFTQGITLLIRDDLSVEQAMAYQERSDQHEGNNYEMGIALLLAYVEGWEVDGADSGAPLVRGDPPARQPGHLRGPGDCRQRQDRPTGASVRK